VSLTIRTFFRFLEAVSKPQIRFKGKAQTDEKAEHINICEHFEEGCNAAIGPQMGF
jgi:hypothetical protein